MHEAVTTSIKRVLGLCMALSLSVMAVLVFLNVVLRYLFDSGITWSEEMSRYVFVFMIFFGAALAFIEKQHLAADLLSELLPPWLRRLFVTLCSLLMLLALGLMIDGSWQLMWINQNSKGPATGFPLWALYAGCIAMAGVMTAYLLAELLRQWRSRPAREE
ncbi:TRAP transporter small permease [Telmatospirillum sp. J64-1]|uniref:TRAP transporter small permease n=1 Tax=Telmatospirillum sp. J64-1 TaxID=2502183 RepID=UPI00115DEFDF|nr:TRAP transporter small permease [Telmatospirillum sp. J64-1]